MDTCPNRTVRIVKHLSSDRADNESSELPIAVGGHHDEIKMLGGGQLYNLLGRITAQKKPPDVKVLQFLDQIRLQLLLIHFAGVHGKIVISKRFNDVEDGQLRLKVSCKGLHHPGCVSAAIGKIDGKQDFSRREHRTTSPFSLFDKSCYGKSEQDEPDHNRRHSQQSRKVVQPARRRIRADRVQLAGFRQPLVFLRMPFLKLFLTLPPGENGQIHREIVRTQVLIEEMDREYEPDRK